ncbi:MAG: hypothetical protein SF123_17530 [Chloroflexota bacterium]|nr:hypothetical protein [Chloroflexota bacterium]
MTFLLDSGYRILNGQLPYVDFFEVNLLPIFYLSTVPVWVSQWSGLGVIVVTHLMVFALTLASAAITDNLLVHAHQHRALLLINRSYVPILYGLLTGIAFMFGYGQREHLLMLAFMPWMFLRCLRLQNHPYPHSHALLLGVASAVAFTLKPHYALMVIFVELMLVARARHWRLYLQPEIAGVFGVALVYAVYVLAFPQVIEAYLTRVIPIAVMGYDVLGNLTVFDLTWGDPGMRILILLALAGFAVGMRRGANATLMQASTLAVIGAVIGFAVQGKGWSYHQIPATWAGTWLVAMLIRWITLRPAIQNLLRRLKHLHVIMLGIGVFGVFTILFVSTLLWAQSPYLQSDRDVILSIQTRVLETDGVMILDPYLTHVYPTLVQAGHWQALQRYQTTAGIEMAYYGALPTDVYMDSHVPPPVAEDVVGAIISSLSAPTMRLVLIRDGISPFGNYQVDTYRYLMARPAIRTILDQEYVYLETIDEFRIYERKRD